MTIAEILGPGPALCLGIDPHASLLADWGLPDAARGAREFGLRAAEAAIAAGTPVVKPQVAFFERFGAEGIAALGDVIAAARAAGLWVIADAKRGDIGSTMDGYADAWLAPGAPLESDAITVSPYLGLGALAPAFEAAKAHDRVVFVLVATSNAEAAAVQRASTASGRSLAADILEGVRHLNRSAGRAVGPLGVVLGATIELAGFGIDPDDGSGIPILAPGFGAQGASLGELRTRFGGASSRVIANVGRDALSAGPEVLAARLRALAEELAQGVAA